MRSNLKIKALELLFYILTVSMSTSCLWCWIVVLQSDVTIGEDLVKGKQYLSVNSYNFVWNYNYLKIKGLTKNNGKGKQG